MVAFRVQPKSLSSASGIAWISISSMSWKLELAEPPLVSSSFAEGMHWHGLDRTGEAVFHTRTCFEVFNLLLKVLKQGSAYHIPYPNHTFVFVYSHGVRRFYKSPIPLDHPEKVK